MGPLAGERLELAGECGDDSDAFHWELVLMSLILFSGEFTTESTENAEKDIYGVGSVGYQGSAVGTTGRLM
jgi:hypothetical protein